MIRSMLHRLKRDERGAAVIELALAAPVLALMTVGIADLSNGFNRKLNLEQASQRAIEKVMQTTGTTTVEATIIAEAAAQAKVPVSNVSVAYQLECNGTKQTNPSGTCAAGQKEARYIMVTVTDKYTPMFPMKFGGINADGTYHLSATAGMRTQ
jgi:Flp pilus assembly protein TadG